MGVRRIVVAVLLIAAPLSAGILLLGGRSVHFGVPIPPVTSTSRVLVHSDLGYGNFTGDVGGKEESSVANEMFANYMDSLVAGNTTNPHLVDPTYLLILGDLLQDQTGATASSYWAEFRADYITGHSWTVKLLPGNHDLAVSRDSIQVFMGEAAGDTSVTYFDYAGILWIGVGEWARTEDSDEIADTLDARPSGYPVILYQHYGMDLWTKEQWWDIVDAGALTYYDTVVLQGGYNILAILHGHVSKTWEPYRYGDILVVNSVVTGRCDTGFHTVFSYVNVEVRHRTAKNATTISFSLREIYHSTTSGCITGGTNGTWWEYERPVYTNHPYTWSLDGRDLAADKNSAYAD